MKRKLMKSVLAAMVAGIMMTTGCTSKAEEPANSDTSATPQETEAGTDENTAAPEADQAEDQKGDKGSYKIGYTIQDLANPTWAAKIQYITEMCDELGWEVAAVDNGADSGKQITQVENFVTSGVDVVVVQPADANSLTDVSKKAHDKGIYMMADGVSFPEADLSYINDNFTVGKMVGTACGEWLNKTFGEDAKTEVAIYEWPSIKECIDRVDGMKEGLKETAPNAQVVASASAANVTDGMSNAENILQAHPEVKAFMCFGDGGALGASEVLEAKGTGADEVGIFSIDGTDEALTKIKNNTPFKMSVSLGSPKGQADGIMEALKALFSGSYEEVYYTPNEVVDSSNVDEYLK
ncbi:sugar ABC transporter substrate-binding protein [Diplocloster agilis]|uniref:sugar ABC transporter substrate-binding protein n=1 Tax=Diplocloster agilis TaxID=2850323 RepID=UPI000822F14D|nr:sugar ABC transporter substrate-binding protein [Suonthocola fibrivorans]MCU6735231.1 sugar ABC transporter substrate-binding protein [Suonthocola fibrivorans]SCJ68033.1 D-ribose-binding periplasmic protein precursor [uncultured Clostridium sp.]